MGSCPQPPTKDIIAKVKMGQSDRRSIRLKDYDYSQAGSYFVTICTKDRKNLFGVIDNTATNFDCNAKGSACDISDNILQISETGQMVKHYLQNIGTVYENVVLDCFIIMPNHIHCIINLNYGLQSICEGRLRAAAPTLELPQIVNSFKTLTSKKYGQTLWQRNYYEHIIRNENELKQIRQYITDNPLKWYEDEYYA